MKVKVLDELSQKRNGSIQEDLKNYGLPNEAQLLLTASVAERDILREAGLDHNIKKVESAKGINLERDNFENTYARKVFTEDEIKDICQKYNLRLLHSRKYNGTIDTALASRIIEFFKESGVDSHRYEASNNLYIMAPPEMFDAEKKRQTISDPIMFYRVAKQGSIPMYVPVHQWGNDFSIIRRINGIINYNFWTHSVYCIARNASAILMIFAIFRVVPYGLLPITLSLILGFIWHIIASAAIHGDSDGSGFIGNQESRFSQGGWNESYNL